METRSFTIPASKLIDVQDKLTKLNKRAAKLGVQEITWTIGKAYTKTYQEQVARDQYSTAPIEFVTREVLVAPFDITGPLSVKFDGWSFAATFQHLPTGETIIRAISNEIEVPTYYRDTGSACEHCKVKRYRKDTYLLNHEDGSLVQVGSTCIKDFLGGNSPDNIMSSANLIGEILSYMGCMEEGYGGGGSTVYAIEVVLAQTSACIRDHGWLSKSKAEETNGRATAYRVADNFDPPRNFKKSIVSDCDEERAKLAVEWVESLSDTEVEDSDYLYNIRAIARSGMVEHRTMGFACSIIPAYDRAMEAKNPKKLSKHVGQLKKRELFNLILKRHFVYDGTYGASHRYLFEDDDGNVLVWKSSSSHDMVEGKKYCIKGTVKEHSDYKNVPQTMITRCEVMNSYDSDH